MAVFIPVTGPEALMKKPLTAALHVLAACSALPTSSEAAAPANWQANSGHAEDASPT